MKVPLYSVLAFSSRSAGSCAKGPRSCLSQVSSSLAGVDEASSEVGRASKRPCDETRPVLGPCGCFAWRSPRVKTISDTTLRTAASLRTMSAAYAVPIVIGTPVAVLGLLSSIRYKPTYCLDIAMREGRDGTRKQAAAVRSTARGGDLF